MITKLCLNIILKNIKYYIFNNFLFCLDVCKFLRLNTCVNGPDNHDFH